MVILLPVLLSIDSLLASAALCFSRVERRGKVQLAFAFGVCDGAASLLGWLYHWPLAGAFWLSCWQFQLALYVYLAAVFAFWFLEFSKRLGAALVWMLPVVLAIDNLACPGSPVNSIGAIATVAAVSTTMSLLGFALGTYLRKICRNKPVLARMSPRLQP